jgi:hypothetical protein
VVASRRISQEWKVFDEPAGIFATHWRHRRCGTDGLLQSNEFCGRNFIAFD